jgi:hypothetical protein
VLLAPRLSVDSLGVNGDTMHNLQWQKPRKNMKRGSVRVQRFAFFGDCSRYRVDEFLSRSGDVRYLVLDAERPDHFDCAQGRSLELPGIIRDEKTLDAALAGLGLSE